MTIQTSEFFYIPVTARSWGNVDFGLKSHMKGLMNRTTKRTIVQCTCTWDQQTRVSLCIDPLYKASFLDSPESEEGAYCTISEGSDQNVMLQSHCLSRFGQSAIEGKYDQWMLWSEYAVAQIDPSLRSSHKTFCKPIDCRRYIRLAKALIRLLMCRLRVCRLIRLFVQVIVGFAMHRPIARFVCANHNA